MSLRQSTTLNEESDTFGVESYNVLYQRKYVNE